MVYCKKLWEPLSHKPVNMLHLGKWTHFSECMNTISSVVESALVFYFRSRCRSLVLPPRPRPVAPRVRLVTLSRNSLNAIWSWLYFKHLVFGYWLLLLMILIIDTWWLENMKVNDRRYKHFLDDGMTCQKGVKWSCRKTPRASGTKQRGKRRLKNAVNGFSKRTIRRDDRRSGVRVTCGGGKRSVRLGGNEMWMQKINAETRKLLWVRILLILLSLAFLLWSPVSALNNNLTKCELAYSITTLSFTTHPHLVLRKARGEIPYFPAGLRQFLFL